MKASFWIACGLSLVVCVAAAESIDLAWSQQKKPVTGPARSIGDYSAGCLQGASMLPQSGPGYDVMHPSRLRYFGHPTLVDFIETLGRAVAEQKLASLLVGDLAQPRGGRAPGGHASHQTGLDVDLWYVHDASASSPLGKSARETLKAATVLDAKSGGIQKLQVARVRRLLQLTAADARVERVFVHPLIKRELCTYASNNTPTERAWLGKLRPWYGHDDHFHVRLACPKDSPDCASQQAVADGDGCGELDYWLSEKARAERARGQQEYQRKVVSPRAMPAQCLALLNAP